MLRELSASCCCSRSYINCVERKGRFSNIKTLPFLLPFTCLNTRLRMETMKLSVIILAFYLATVGVESAGPKICAGQCIGLAAAYEQCNAQNTTTACNMSHCFAGIGKWRESGTEKTGYMNGCIDCADKKKACDKLLEPYSKLPNVEILACELECCTTDMCNVGLNATVPAPTSPHTKTSPSPPRGHGVFISGSPVVLLAAFAMYFGF